MPVTSVLMKLPLIVMLPAMAISIPALVPTMTLRASTVSPPMMVLGTLLAGRTPIKFGSAPVPAALVPIKFPCTTFPLELTAISTPKPLPEITLREAGDSPPILLELAPALTATPLAVLGIADWPVGSVPMKLPSITLLLLVARTMAESLNPFNTNPRTVLPLLPLPLKRRPWKLFPVTPRISIRNTALVPVVIGFVLGLAPGWL